MAISETRPCRDAAGFTAGVTRTIRGVAVTGAEGPLLARCGTSDKFRDVTEVKSPHQRAAALFTTPVYGSRKDRNIQVLSLTMTRRWLILADDLTGAADCAIALGGRGLAAVVTWGDIGNVRSRQEPILAYDTQAGVFRPMPPLLVTETCWRAASVRAFLLQKDRLDLAGAACSGDCGDARMSAITIGFGIWSACSRPFLRPVARPGTAASSSMAVRSRKQTSGDATIAIPRLILLTFSQPLAFAARKSCLPPSVVAS